MLLSCLSCIVYYNILKNHWVGKMFYRTKKQINNKRINNEWILVQAGSSDVNTIQSLEMNIPCIIDYAYFAIIKNATH